eukprot:jgi/Mesen1/2977/ME000176S02018
MKYPQRNGPWPKYIPLLGILLFGGFILYRSVDSGAATVQTPNRNVQVEDEQLSEEPVARKSRQHVIADSAKSQAESKLQIEPRKADEDSDITLLEFQKVPLEIGDHSCSSEAIARQETQIKFQKDKGLGCAEPVDFERFVASIWPPSSEMTLVNIGANKGYNVAKWMAYWSPQYGVEPKSWGAYLLKRYSEVFTKWSMCGVCGDCNEDLKRWHLTDTKTTEVPRILALEPSKHTYNLLREFRKWSEYPRLEVHRMAASNASYVTKFVDTRPGDELHSLGTSSSANTSDVQVVSVDDLVRDLKIGHMHILKIDTEGFDPLVLQGARKTLESGAVSVLEFEYHHFHHWAIANLEDVVNELDALNFECFLKGVPAERSYFRLTRCWSEELEVKTWSNVICSNRKEVEITLFLLDHSLFI